MSYQEKITCKKASNIHCEAKKVGKFLLEYFDGGNSAPIVTQQVWVNHIVLISQS
jgi:hypothetical protein